MALTWVDKLLDRVMNHWHWQGLCHHIGYHVTPPTPPDDEWEVEIIPAVQEILGGEKDGEEVWTPFVFDVGDFLKEKGVQCNNVVVCTHSPSMPMPNIVLYIAYRKRNICLRINLEPPPEATPTEMIDTIRHTIVHKCKHPPKEEHDE